jgi:hypothetical protein
MSGLRERLVCRRSTDVLRVWLGLALAQCASEPAAPEPSSSASDVVLEPTRAGRAVARVRQDLSRSERGLERRRRPNGLVQLDVKQGYRHATIAVRQPDGTVRARCVEDAEQAARMLEDAQ